MVHISFTFLLLFFFLTFSSSWVHLYFIIPFKSCFSLTLVLQFLCTYCVLVSEVCSLSHRKYTFWQYFRVTLRSQLAILLFYFITSVCWFLFLFPVTWHIHLCLSFSNIFYVFSSYSSSTYDILLSSPGPYYPLLDYLFSFTSALRFIYTFVLLLFQLSEKFFKWTNLDTFDIIFQITVSLLLLWSNLRY